MKSAKCLLCLGLLLGVPLWAQSASSQAPKSRKAAKTTVHRPPRHAARRLSLRERQEQARMQAEQRRQAKLAKKQRKQAMKRSRRMRKMQTRTQ